MFRAGVLQNQKGHPTLPQQRRYADNHGRILTTFEVLLITLISENTYKFFLFCLNYFHEIYKTDIHFY